MQLGVIGLGRMGANIVRRLQRDGHECVVFDRNPAAVTELAGEGANGAASLDDFVAKLSRPRAAWLMVPAVAHHDRSIPYAPGSWAPAEADALVADFGGWHQPHGALKPRVRGRAVMSRRPRGEDRRWPRR